MIPTIGLMIGAYIILRCLEILAKPAAEFNSSGARRGVMIFAVLVFLVSVLGVGELLRSGSDVTERLRVLGLR